MGEGVPMLHVCLKVHLIPVSLFLIRPMSPKHVPMLQSCQSNTSTASTKIWDFSLNQEIQGTSQIFPKGDLNLCRYIMADPPVFFVQIKYLFNVKLGPVEFKKEQCCPVGFQIP